jgi:hypothetical protein
MTNHPMRKFDSSSEFPTVVVILRTPYDCCVVN